MNEQERAEEHLRTIRRLMERATIYRAISAPTALVGGLLSLVATGVWVASPIQDYSPHSSFLILWLVVLLLTAGTNTLFIVVGARKRNEPVFSASMKAAFTALAPAFLTAAILTLIFVAATPAPFNKPTLFATLPLLSIDEASLGVTWAICYGLGLLATSHFAPKSLTLLGWAFLISGLGIVTMARFANNYFIEKLVDSHAIYFMALTFGFFHLIYAFCAWPRKGAAPEL